MMCAVIGVDIRNAFNFLPWNKILEALNPLRLPQCVKYSLRDYMRSRMIVFKTRDGAIQTRLITVEFRRGQCLALSCGIL